MNYLQVLKSKIHGAIVTKADLDYEGSITIDSELMKMANIREYERVQVLNLTNGERIETYVIKGNAGEICLNGAAAHKFSPGQTVLILSYLFTDSAYDFEPTILLPDHFTDEINKFIIKQSLPLEVKTQWNDISSKLKKFCDDNNYTSMPLRIPMPFIIKWLEENYYSPQKR